MQHIPVVREGYTLKKITGSNFKRKKCKEKYKNDGYTEFFNLFNQEEVCLLNKRNLLLYNYNFIRINYSYFFCYTFCTNSCMKKKIPI